MNLCYTGYRAIYSGELSQESSARTAGEPSGSGTIRLLTSAFEKPVLSLTRRALMAGMFATACGRKRAARYQGWLLVASGAERAVAVANLAQFKRVTTIPLPHVPDQLFLAGNRVFVTSREGAELIEIDTAGFRVSGRIALPGKPVGATLLQGNLFLAAMDEPAGLAVVDLTTGRVSGKTGLPAAPVAADISSGVVAMTLAGRNSIIRIASPNLKIMGETEAGAPCGPIRFRNDGKTILAGIPSTREIITVDARTGEILAKLPLPISPLRFCFNGDGGQMFVTGTGEDSLAIVNAYQNEIDQTILAGRTPGAMAVSRSKNLLFVANTASGDLTILDIDTRHLSASVHVGGQPGEVLLTPDGEYALVVDPVSGSVSVARITTVLDHAQVALIAQPPKPLFTVFQTATDARSAIIVPFET
ncbi:MAG TPA: YncE family protein [Bryobacteraceae bacterium]|jgi:YVTN family beta-propeller protein|nr:YncE family protein [Bryobacteraceae bacterium]